MPAQRFVASHPIPTNKAGRPLQSTVITCLDDKVQLPPGLSRLTTSEAKAELQHLEPRLDVSTIDKAPAPKTEVEEAKESAIRSWKRLFQYAYDFIVAVAHAAVATDPFTGSDPDLGANWDPGVEDPCIRFNDEALYNNPGLTCWETYNALIPGGNQYGKITIGTYTAGAGSFVGVTVRSASAADQMYICQAEVSGLSTTTRIRRRNSGGTNLATENSTTWATGNTIELRAVGTALDCMRNGSTILSTTDATFATGRVGIFMNTNSGTVGIDQIELGDFGAAGGGTGQRKVTMIQ